MVFYVQLPKSTFDIDNFNKITLNSDNIVLSGKTSSITIYERDIESEHYLDELYYDLGDYLNRYEDDTYIQLPKVTFNVADYNHVLLNEEKQQIVLYNGNTPEIYISFDSVSEEYETLEDLYIELSDILMELNDSDSDDETEEEIKQEPDQEIKQETKEVIVIDE